MLELRGKIAECYVECFCRMLYVIFKDTTSEDIDKIKTRKDEKKYLTKLLKEDMEDNYYNLIEELEFVDSNILKDIRGEK